MDVSVGISTTSTTLFFTMKLSILNGIKKRFNDEIVKGDTYMLASFLDPRVKDSVFKGIDY